MAKLLWSEARCSFMSVAGTDLFGDIDCNQTAPGGFGVRAASNAARDAGWVTVGGEWCCPRCRYRKEAHGDKIRKRKRK